MSLIKSITTLGSVQTVSISKSSVSSSFGSVNQTGFNQNSSLVDLDICAKLLGLLGISVKAKVL